MKKITNLMFATALVCGATFLSSCDDAIDNPTPTEAEDVEEIYSKGEFVMSDEFKYAGKAYINSTVNADIAKVLEQLMSNRQQAIDENTNVIVLNKLSDLPFDKLEEAYYNGAIIAVALPVKSEIDAFFAAHPDWDAPLSDQDMDDALLYAFDFDGYDWTVVGKKNDNSRVTLDDPNDAFLLDDPFFAPMKEAPKWPTTSEDGNYTEEDLDYLLSSWTKGLEEERTLSEEIKKEQQNEAAQAREYLTRAATDNAPAPVNVKTAFAYKTYGKTFKRKLRSRWTKDFDMTADDWRDETSIGSTLSVRYNVYTVHVYDGSTGEGDYYLINMEADMNFGGSVPTGYKKHKIDHNYYWFGPFGKGFAVSTCPATTTDPKTSKDYKDSEVVFLGGKGAIPETTQGSTSYSDEYSFSFKLDASVSVKGEATKETSGADVKAKTGVSAEGKASVGWGWNWAEKVQRSVGDISIKNTASRGNDQSHEIVFENLPKSDKSKGWIEQKGNNSYKSTTKLKSTWGWYKKSERDDSENKALVLHVRGRIDYQWWYHDGAGWFNIGNIDEHKAHNHEWINTYIQLDPIFRKRVGQIELVNDLGDKIYIKNIKVYPKDDPKQVVTFARSYPAKEKINLGCRLTTGKYLIEFDAQKAGNDKITHYKYSSNEYLPLDHKVPNVFYAGTDFKAQ